MEKYTREHQLGVWFLEGEDTWVSTDSKGLISFWDIAEQKMQANIRVPLMYAESKVLELAEVNHLKLLAASTSEQTTYFYSLTELKLVMKLKLDSCGFNCMKYSEKFQVLLVSGYENVTNVFTFTPQIDIQCVGRLVGHSGIVEAVELVKDSVMAITADDKGVAKLWDLRKLACIQTIILDNRANIRAILHLSNQDKLAFVGDRINSLMFEPDTAQTKIKESPYPFSFDLNEETGLLYIATKNEVRVLSLWDGRVKKVFENLLEFDQGDELTYFKFLPKRGIFILGDFNGRLGFFNSTTSKVIRSFHPHNGAITAIGYDFDYEMVMTTAADHKMLLHIEEADLPEDQPDDVDDTVEREEFFNKPIMHLSNMPTIIQGYNREEELEKDRIATEKARSRMTKHEKIMTSSNKTDLQTLRSIERVNEDSEVAIAEFSIYHNLVALGTSYQKVYLYNYETFRPVGIIELKENEDLTSMTFLNGYSKLAIGTSTGTLLFLSILFTSNTSIEVFLDISFDIRSNIYLSGTGKKIKCLGFGNKILSDVTLNESESLGPFIAENSPNKKTLMQPAGKLHLESGVLFVAESTGVICSYNLQEFLATEPKFKPYKVNPNYNPFRKIQEDYINLHSTLQGKVVQVSKLTPRLQNTKFPSLNIRNFKAARDLITQLHLCKADQRVLMMTSLDCTFRIFTEEGSMLCHLNLNHPLPILWNFTPESLINKAAKVVFALKMVEVMNQRYQKSSERVPLTIRKLIEIYTGHEFKTFSMTSIEQEASIGQTPTAGLGFKKIDTINMLLDDNSSKKIAKRKPKEGPQQLPAVHPNSDKPNKNPNTLLMKDLFTPKDIFFERIKLQNREEVQGPSLRQLETIRRAKNILKMSDPLYGKSQEESVKTAREDEEAEKLIHQVSNLPRMEYEDPMETEKRRRAIQNSFGMKMVTKLSKIDDLILEKRTAELSRLSQNVTESSTSKNPIDIIDLKKRVSKLGYSPKPFLSGRKSQVPLSQRFKSHHLAVESSLHNVSQRSKIDMFEYASEKNLLNEDSESAKDMFKSQVLHESSQLTSSTRNLFNLDRKQEQKVFQNILKELDKRKLKAKTSARASQNDSKFSLGAYIDGESTVLPSAYSHPHKPPSVSLPRLKKSAAPAN